MTPAEIRRGAARSTGSACRSREVDVLVARTEGWAAGVRLSAMRMEGTEHPADFVSQLALDPGSIGEYLVDEVLRRLPEPHRRLLIETSFLDEVTGPLADAVTGMAGCGDMLADLAREQLLRHTARPAADALPLPPAVRGDPPLPAAAARRPGGPRLKTRAAAWFEAQWRPGQRPVLGGAGWRRAACRRAAGPGRAGARVRAPAGPVRASGCANWCRCCRLQGADRRAGRPSSRWPSCRARDRVRRRADPRRGGREPGTAAGVAVRAQALADPDLLVTCDLVELLLGQKACDADAVDAAARRLLGGSGDAPAPVIPGLRAAVLLAQASAHLWHGRHEDVGALLDEALAEARRDGQAWPGARGARHDGVRGQLLVAGEPRGRGGPARARAAAGERA